MKVIALLMLFGLTANSYAQNQVSNSVSISPPASRSFRFRLSPYAVTTRGPHQRVWQQNGVATNTLGQTVYRTNSYNEIATGRCYWNGSQWADSSDQIQLTSNGAIATNTQHQVAFAANINTAGAINLTTPDNHQMSSQVLGLAYTDASTSNSVLFAETQDSIGQLLSSGNQVIYTNAFSNANCDVLYTHRWAGFEQDVVIRQQLPSPASCGLNGTNIWLQVWTEFIVAPTPQMTHPPGSGDTFLDFGAMKMGQGKAFMLGGASNAVPVVKEWVSSQGRTFLVESVQLNAIAAKLAQLPLAGSSSGNSNSMPGSGSIDGGQSKIQNSHPALASLAPPSPNFKSLKLPSSKIAKKSSAAMNLASDSPNLKGLVLDYNAINGSQTNFTFRSDTTYFITGELDLYGTTTIEGGTVIKYSANGNETICPAHLVWQTGSYRPAVFTAMDDDSIGDQITGSSGVPTGSNYGFIALNLGGCDTSLISNARFSFLNAAVAVGNGTIRDVQFNQCQTVMAGDNQGFDGGGSFSFYNVLAWNIGTFIGWEGSYGGQTATCENCTIDGCSVFFVDYTSIVNLDNCICAGIGTWNAYETRNNNSVILGDDSGVFQSVGAGNFYLAPGTYQGQGTSGIDSTLFADLSQRTTYPPTVLSNITTSTNTTLGPIVPRDNSGDPDLGYHYDALDYIVDAYAVTNAILTLTNGVAIGCYNDAAGIWLQDGSSLVSVGTPTIPNWLTRYSSVQEQAVGIGSAGLWDVLTVNSYYFGSIGPKASFLFTKFSCTAGGGYHLYHNYNWAYNSLLVQNCELYSGQVDLSGDSGKDVAIINNNLFQRAAITAMNFSTDASLAFSNNLVLGTTVRLSGSAGFSWFAYNNIFDTCLIGRGSLLTNDYNAYLNCSGIGRFSPNGADDIVLTNSLSYQSGPLGIFYQPSDSPLLNQGSTNANLVGLTDYTTQINQVKEGTNIVSIGYHYVALNPGGNPNSTLWTGIPDYIVDTNGSSASNIVTWQTKYFGYVGLNPNANPYGQCMNLFQDYETGTDPSDPTCVTNLVLGRWPFDNTNTWVGITGSMPVVCSNIVGTMGIISNAVQIDSSNAAILTYHEMESNEKANINCRQGTVRFWFRPAWTSSSLGGTGLGSMGRLIEIGSYSATPLITNGWWALALDGGGNTLSFATATNGSIMTNLSANISWASNEWYEVDLTYTPTNSQLYINFQLLTNGTGVIYYPNAIERNQSGLRIGSDESGSHQAVGAFDELQIFNYAMTTNEISPPTSSSDEVSFGGGVGTCIISYYGPVLGALAGVDVNSCGPEPAVTGETVTIEAQLYASYGYYYYEEYNSCLGYVGNTPNIYYGANSGNISWYTTSGSPTSGSYSQGSSFAFTGVETATVTINGSGSATGGFPVESAPTLTQQVAVLPEERLAYWSFNGVWNGDGGQLPAVQENVTFVSSPFGQGVLFNSTNNVDLQYAVSQNDFSLVPMPLGNIAGELYSSGTPNIRRNRGTVRFWFMPNWSSGIGPTNNGTFVNMLGGGWLLQVVTNGTNIQLISGGTTAFSQGINWTNGQWHQIAVTYTTTKSVLYVDGYQLGNNGSGLPNIQCAFTGNFRVGSDGGQGQVKGIIDGLETFNYDLSAATILSDYQAVSVYDCNCDGLTYSPGNPPGNTSGNPAANDTSPPVATVLQPINAVFNPDAY